MTPWVTLDAANPFLLAWIRFFHSRGHRVRVRWQRDGRVLVYRPAGWG